MDKFYCQKCGSLHVQITGHYILECKMCGWKVPMDSAQISKRIINSLRSISKKAEGGRGPSFEGA